MLNICVVTLCLSADLPRSPNCSFFTPHIFNVFIYCAELNLHPFFFCKAYISRTLLSEGTIKVDKEPSNGEKQWHGHCNLLSSLIWNASKGLNASTDCVCSFLAKLRRNHRLTQTFNGSLRAQSGVHLRALPLTMRVILSNTAWDLYSCTQYILSLNKAIVHLKEPYYAKWCVVERENWCGNNQFLL